jgi:hypothetical protein
MAVTTRPLYKLGRSENRVWMSYFPAGQDNYGYIHYLALPHTVERVQEFIQRQRALADRMQAECVVCQGLANYLGDLAVAEYTTT